MQPLLCTIASVDSVPSLHSSRPRPRWQSPWHPLYLVCSRNLIPWCQSSLLFQAASGNSIDISDLLPSSHGSQPQTQTHPEALALSCLSKPQPPPSATTPLLWPSRLILKQDLHLLMLLPGLRTFTCTQTSCSSSGCPSRPRPTAQFWARLGTLPVSLPFYNSYIYLRRSCFCKLFAQAQLGSTFGRF